MMVSPSFTKISGCPGYPGKVVDSTIPPLAMLSELDSSYYSQQVRTLNGIDG
jgi:hypothetical protein